MQLAGGVKAIHVGTMHVSDHASKCFYIYKLDGSKEDFSYVKCLHTIFGGEPSMQDCKPSCSEHPVDPAASSLFCLSHQPQSGGILCALWLLGVFDSHDCQLSIKHLITVYCCCMFYCEEFHYDKAEHRTHPPRERRERPHSGGGSQHGRGAGGRQGGGRGRGGRGGRGGRFGARGRGGRGRGGRGRH